MANKKRKKANEIPNQKKKANPKNTSKTNNQPNPKNEINEKLKQVLIEKLIEKLK